MRHQQPRIELKRLEDEVVEVVAARGSEEVADVEPVDVIGAAIERLPTVGSSDDGGISRRASIP